MLENFLHSLCLELMIEIPKPNPQKVYSLKLGREVVELRDLDPGVACKGVIRAVPEKRKEELAIFLMRANLLGQGTGGARIGWSENGNFLTLSLGLPYELDYRKFKETVELFVNYQIYWRDAVNQFEEET